jgi:hypothetical protein
VVPALTGHIIILSLTAGDAEETVVFKTPQTIERKKVLEK